MLNSAAVIKIQAVIIVTIIAIAAVAGVVYVWLREDPSEQTIKIGICGDLDNFVGKSAWQGAVLAAEQINAEGGVLGRNFEIVSEDDDSESQSDVTVASNAMTKLITVDHADFIIASSAGTTLLMFQDMAAEHHKILFSVSDVSDELTQRVQDNYDKYKYFFRAGLGNTTAAIDGMADGVRTVAEYTGFTKVAYLVEDIAGLRAIAAGLDEFLPTYDLDIVYRGIIPPATTDFTSSFAAIEASGAEILVPIIVTQTGSFLISEWYNRQSPVVVWGYITMAMDAGFWQLTEGTCDSVSFVGLPIIGGYPLTNKTVPSREALIERWGALKTGAAAMVYDVVRFILPDAIRRAGTTETEAVIKALEETDVETSCARRFVFTQSHDIMVASAASSSSGDIYMLVCMFQWQNGTQVPVYPKEILNEAGASYTFPDWHGPWDDLD
jgi:branched-chain amino acid transport system substrate-binding protein